MELSSRFYAGLLNYTPTLENVYMDHVCEQRDCAFPFPANRNLNTTANEGILDNCVPPTMWLQFGEKPHMGVMVKGAHTSGHLVLGYTYF